MFASLKKLAIKFEPAQIVRESTQVVGQTKHKSTQVKIWCVKTSADVRFFELMSFLHVFFRAHIATTA